MSRDSTRPFKNDTLTSGEQVDIIVIGAGPAGLNAALHAAALPKPPSVLLVDAIVPWEHPIQCAEAVGRLGFEEAVTVRPAWVRQTISKACFHAPDGSTITYSDKNKGYIIDRARMQRDLAEEFATRGGRCIFNRRATAISMPSAADRRRTVTFDNGETVSARAVIDASGPVGCFGKTEKIVWKPEDLEPAYFIFAESIDLPDDTVHIYVGRDLAPGGYAWVFPRGKNAANIGLLVGHEFRGKVNIRGLLDAFLARQFPTITIVKRFAGAIPCGYQKGPVTAPGLIKTGDAASTVNPISRAGIAEALLSGGLAGDHALQMLSAKNDREMQRIGKAYEKAWFKKRGDKHDKLSRVKKAMRSVPDDDYNIAASSLTKIPQNELTMSRIFRTALGRFPRLVWALRHLM